MTAFGKGFMDVIGEYDNVSLEVSGAIPEWLSGNLVINGSAKFQLPHQHITHWFFGAALLKSFKISSQKISYTNRFLHGQFYKKHVADEKPLSEFFGGSRTSLLSHLSEIISTPDPSYDNCNVSISSVNSKPVALTEVTNYVCFDSETLETLGHLNFQDEILGQITTAHPQMDFKRGESYNFVTHFGSKSYYTFYKIKNGTEVRIPVAVIPVQKPAYMHSFAMSENYLILIEPPMRASPLHMRFSAELYFDRFKWDNSQGTRITIIDKNDGKIVRTVETEAFFMFHQICSFEINDHLFIDLPAYSDATVLENAKMDKIIDARISADRIIRIQINLKTGKTLQETILAQRLEFPQLNYKKYNGKEYRYFYASGDWHDLCFNSIVKVDVKNGDNKTWAQANCFMGEPLFIENPQAKNEDDGVILCVGLDANADKSFLIILDAKTLEEKARAYAPHIIPYSFHGAFFPKK